MIRSLLIIVFSSFLLSSKSQSGENIDSLKNVLKLAQHDSTRCNIINRLIDAEKDPVQIYKFIEKLKTISETNLKTLPKDGALKAFYLKHLADAYNNSAVMASQNGDFDKALKEHLLSLKIKEGINSRSGVAQSLSNIGFLYFSRGNIKEALSYNNKSLKIREELKDKKGIAESFNNIAGIYISQGNIQKGLEFFTKSLKIKEEINDKKGIAISLNNLADIYDSEGNISKAFEYYNKSITIFEEIGYKSGVATLYGNLGSMFKKEKDYNKAMEYYNKSLALNEQLQNKEGMAYTLSNIGRLMYSNNKTDEGLKYIERSLKLSQELGYPDIIAGNAAFLKQIYQKQNLPAKALEMYELFIQMRDSVNNMQNKELALKAEMHYEYEKKEAVLKEQQDKERIVAEDKNRFQKLISWSIGGGLLLVIIFSIFIFNRLQLTRKQKLVIEEQKQIVEEHQKEIVDSITYAKRLQEAILPPLAQITEHLPNNFVFYKPKDIVAGDFYWFEQKDELLFISAADCTGHGVPGALVSVVCCNALNRTVSEFGIKMPGEILDKTRELVIATFEKSHENVKDGMDISLCCLNKNTNELLWAGANNPLWYVQDGIMKEIKPDKQPIGKTENSKPFKTHSVQLNKGDSVYIFTDGFADQFGGEKGKKFKYKQLNELLSLNSKKSMEEQKELLHSSFNNWKTTLEQVDDVCLIGIKI